MRQSPNAKVYLAGASIGANAALSYAARDNSIAGVVLLSPGIDYHGVKTQEAAAAYAGRKALVVAAKGDQYAYSSSTTLAGAIGPSAELVELDGSAHGTDLLDGSTNARIVEWLGK